MCLFGFTKENILLVKNILMYTTLGFCVILDRFHFKNKNRPIVSVLLTLHVLVCFSCSYSCVFLLLYYFVWTSYFFLLYILKDNVSNTKCYFYEYVFIWIVYFLSHCPYRVLKKPHLMIDRLYSFMFLIVLY